MLNDVYADSRDRMKKVIENLEREFKRVRTGRASVAVLDGIRLDYYGTPTPLNQIATLTVPEPRSITIQPWDATVIGDVEKSILKSELGLTPMNDGKMVRINIPPLTEERRRDLVKVVRKMAEESKVKLRNARRDANERFKSLKKENTISEDEMFTQQEQVQKLTDKAIEKIDAMLAAKEKDIMQI